MQHCRRRPYGRLVKPDGLRPKAGACEDGTHFWASVVVDAVRDLYEVIGFAKVTRDRLPVRPAQETMLESERRYRRLIEAVTDYAIFQLGTK